MIKSSVKQYNSLETWYAWWNTCLESL